MEAWSVPLPGTETMVLRFSDVDVSARTREPIATYGSDRIGLASEAALHGTASTFLPLQPWPGRDRVQPPGGFYCFEEAPFA